MSREMTLIVLGLLVIVIPYTGFPSFWRTLFLVVCGAIVAIVGFLMRGHTISKPQKKHEHHTFQESARPMSDMRATEEVSEPAAL